MVRGRIKAAGLLPADLEKAIADALTEENILVDPDVSVSVAEYHSRPITVAGAVKTPVTFQAIGTVTLLEAITRAGGVDESAGPEILVTHPTTGVNGTSVGLTERVLVHALLSGEDPASNLKLEGGENIRVPEAGHVFVVGNVKKPGMFPLTDSPETSVLRAVAFSEGLDSYPGHLAYIYRMDGASGKRIEIPIEVKKIMARKAPDVPLYANDMLYVPHSSGEQASVRALEMTLGIGVGIAGLLVALLR
jgi:polysaccharide export outer membrane protein